MNLSLCFVLRPTRQFPRREHTELITLSRRHQLRMYRFLASEFQKEARYTQAQRSALRAAALRNGSMKKRQRLNALGFLDIRGRVYRALPGLSVSPEPK